MLKLRDPQLAIWDYILQEELQALPEELAKADAILDDHGSCSLFSKSFYLPGP